MDPMLLFWFHWEVLREISDLEVSSQKGHVALTS